MTVYVNKPMNTYTVNNITTYNNNKHLGENPVPLKEEKCVCGDILTMLVDS